MTLKLKRTPGLYLVGFMGSGKTTIGRALADELGWPFCDLDSDIEAKEGRTIAQIFDELGEEHFRNIETAAIRERVAKIESGHPCVVALGGGAFVQPQNWQLIQNNGVTVWLDCSIDVIKRRLGEDTSRPLAADRERMERLFEDRRSIYSRADFRIEVDCDDVNELVRRIVQFPIF